jgi:hypothetical protein
MKAAPVVKEYSIVEFRKHPHVVSEYRKKWQKILRRIAITGLKQHYPSFPYPGPKWGMR